MSATLPLPLTRFSLRASGAWLLPLIALITFLVLLAADANQAAFLALNRLGPLTDDQLWANITVLGDTVVALALCLPLWRRRPDLIWALALGALLATAWVHLLKPVVKVARPPAVLGEQVHVIGPAYRKQSFPSGHSTTAFAVAGLLALGLAPGVRRAAISEDALAPTPTGAAAIPAGAGRLRALGALAVALALLAAASRAVVGVHWPLDVLAGAFGGWLSAALALALAQRTLVLGTHPGVQWGVGLALAGCAVALVVGHDSGYPQALTFQRIIGVASLGCAALTLWRPAAARQGARGADARIDGR